MLPRAVNMIDRATNADYAVSMVTGKTHLECEQRMLIAATVLDPLFEETVGILAEAAMRHPFDKTDGRYAKHAQTIRAFLSTCQPATLHRLREFSLTMDSYSLVHSISTHNEDEVTLNDLIVLHSVLREDKKMTSSKLTIYIRGLEHYEGISLQQAGNYPSKRLEQATAILYITAHLRDAGVKSKPVQKAGEKTYAFIADERIRRLITSHDHPIELANVIRSRNLSSYEDIASYLEAAGEIALSLQTGSL